MLTKFDEYFVPQRNVIHERACFYQRNQQQGETAEMYIRSLYKLAELCDFGATRDEHIRDRLAVGIRDKELSRRFQLTADLTVAKVNAEARQAEVITRQVNLQANQTDVPLANVDAVGRRESQQQQISEWQRRGHSSQTAHKMEECGRCGKPDTLSRDTAPH